MADKITTADGKRYDSAEFEKQLTGILNKHYGRTGDAIYVKPSAIPELMKLLPDTKDWSQLHGQDRICEMLGKNLQMIVDNNPRSWETGVAQALINFLTPPKVRKEQLDDAIAGSKVQPLSAVRNVSAPVGNRKWANIIIDTDSAELPDH